MTFNIDKIETVWEGKSLIIETGKIANLADAAVMVTYGETQILATIVIDKVAKEGLGFLPLTVDYKEMAFSAGKIPGGFYKREGKASEREVLVSRLIDRSLRPIIMDKFPHAMQVITTVLSYDNDSDPIIAAMLAASTVVQMTNIPLYSTVLGVRMGYNEGNYIINPTAEQLKDSVLDLVVTVSKESIFMVESAAKELKEEIFIEAMSIAQKSATPLLRQIEGFATRNRKEVIKLVSLEEDEDFFKEIEGLAKEALKEALSTTSKQERVQKLVLVEQSIIEKFADREIESRKILDVIKRISQTIMREAVLKGRRIDGRDNKTIRPITAEVGLLKKTHGSALFTRGETQALVVVTLGTIQDEQIIDALEGERRESFILHYHFPQYSVGEIGFLKAPGRREVGHAKLGFKALEAMLPPRDECPYTIRIFAEITQSNGSTSMATVCGGSLALMDAGVPIKRPVAGIAMGLVKEGEEIRILSDILGDEDFLGDMDFKVAGTEIGITALQMDIKIHDIDINIISQALDQAREGVHHILKEMSYAISEPRVAFSKNAPVITHLMVDKDKIREVIGSGGKTIREICEKSGAKIDIEDSGRITIAAVNLNNSETAIKLINEIIFTPQVGAIYEGVVIKILEFGIIVKFMSKEGMVHITEISKEKISAIGDIVKEGDVIKVQLISVEPKGKLRLSMKNVDQNTGELIEGAIIEEQREYRGSSGPKKFRKPNFKPKIKSEEIVSEGRKYYE